MDLGTDPKAAWWNTERLALAGAPAGLEVSDVPSNEAHAGQSVLQVRHLPVGQIIQDRDDSAHISEGVHEVRAYEAAPPVTMQGTPLKKSNWSLFIAHFLLHKGVRWKTRGGKWKTTFGFRSFA